MGPRRNPRGALRVRILTIGVGTASDSGVSPYAHGAANRTGRCEQSERADASPPHRQPPKRMRSSRRAQDPPQRRRCHATSTPQPRSPSGGPHGPLEREPSQTGDLRLARLRRCRNRHRHGGRHEDDRHEQQQHGRPVCAGGPDPQARGVQAVWSPHRDRGRPEQAPDDLQSRIPGSDKRRSADCRSPVKRPQPALAAWSGRPGSGIERRPHGPGRMGHERQAQGRREADRSAYHCSEIGCCPAPGLLHRRGRCREFGQGADKAVQRPARTGG